MKTKKDALEGLQFLDKKLQKISSLSSYIQKYKKDTELVNSYSGEILEAVDGLNVLLSKFYRYLSEEGEEVSGEVQDIFHKKNVLLAVPDEKPGESIREILEELGLTVFWVVNGQKALDAFRFSRSQTFAAILMDVHMPDEDDFLIARAIRASHKKNAGGIPLIALLMTQDDGNDGEDIRKIKDAGMTGWLYAPFCKNTVENMLLSLMKNA